MIDAIAETPTRRSWHCCGHSVPASFSFCPRCGNEAPPQTTSLVREMLAEWARSNAAVERHMETRILELEEVDGLLTELKSKPIGPNDTWHHDARSVLVRRFSHLPTRTGQDLSDGLEYARKYLRDRIAEAKSKIAKHNRWTDTVTQLWDAAKGEE